MRIILDFETKSNLDITKTGKTRYLKDAEADIIFMGWMQDNGPVNVWFPAMGKLPSIMYDINPDDRFYAFNANFDMYVWNWIGHHNYGFPIVPIHQWIDVMALCGRYTFPQSLKTAVKAITGGKVLKDPAGKKLIKEITQPPFNYSDDRYEQFKRYCNQDVTATHAILQRLPSQYLSETEQKIWELTQEINANGLPVDTKSVGKIKRVTDNYMQSKLKEITKASKGHVQTVNQVAKIVEFCRLHGVMIDNCTKETVDNTLAEFEKNPKFGPSEVKDLLELRSALGKNSVKKYTTLEASIHQGRIYDNLRYYGASTGRWTGLGFQAHNLPRASVDDPEAEIEKFFDTTIIDEDPLKSAKALIRSMIKSHPDFSILAADYMGIENRLLFWLCDEEEAIQAIIAGLDIYKVVAGESFGIPYEQVDKHYRQRGKTIVLGCGFGLGVEGYKKYASGFGLDLTEAECETTVYGFRNKYSNVRNYWYSAIDTAVRAIQNPGYAVEFGKCHYIVIRDKVGRLWLKLTLPSGRNLFYAEPKIAEGLYGPSIEHRGINPKTKQWSKRWLPPSRLTENIVQATARDVMAEDMNTAKAQGYNLILSVHDEILSEEREEDAQWKLDDLIGIMRFSPRWAPDLPLDATGFISKRYRKD